MQGQGKDGEWRELSMFIGNWAEGTDTEQKGNDDRAGPQRKREGHRLKL